MVHGMKQGRNKYGDQVYQKERRVLLMNLGQAFKGEWQATIHDKGKEDQNYQQDANDRHHHDPSEVDALYDIWISSRHRFRRDWVRVFP